MKAVCVLLLLWGSCFAGDWDTGSVELLVIYTEHELLFEPETLISTVHWQSRPGLWYVRVVGGGERWSDKAPKVLLQSFQIDLERRRKYEEEQNRPRPAADEFGDLG